MSFVTERIYDLYGSFLPELSDVCRVVSAALDQEFRERFSDEIGVYYAVRRPGGESIEIQANRVEDEEGPYDVEPDFLEYATLVRVNRSAQADRVQAVLSQLPDVVFLRRKIVG